MLGNHLIAAWSRVQPRIALSSGEADLYAGLRGISETLGVVHMMREFHTQESCSDVVMEDSSISPSNPCGVKKQFVSI